MFGREQVLRDIKIEDEALIGDIKIEDDVLKFDLSDGEFSEEGQDWHHNSLDDSDNMMDMDAISDDSVSSNASFIEHNNDADGPLKEGEERTWMQTINNFERCAFTGTSGVQIIFSTSRQDGVLLPIDIFLTLINNEVLELMVSETNKYAAQLRNKKPLTQSMSTYMWEETNIEEMKKFIGVMMFMELVNFPRIEFYWKNNSLYYHPLIHQIGMSYKRFAMLLKSWHFTDNSLRQDNTSKKYKIQPLIDAILSNVRRVYTPGDTVVVDQTIIPLSRRLRHKQYNPINLSKFSIKIYKLCTPKGFVYSFAGDFSQDPQISDLDKPGSSVVNLAADLLNQGRLFITDHFYTSIPLAIFMRKNQSDLCGMLSKNRKYIPKEIIAAKLKKGETIARQCSDITILKWHDKRDILMLSTCHDNKIVPTGKHNRLGQPILKPHAVTTYNTGKQGIDVTDRMCSNYSPLRKSVVWYKKVAMELIFGTIVTNSFLIYNEVTGKNYTLLQFTEKLIESLLVVKGERIPYCQPGTHFLSKIPRKEDGKIIRKRCSECYKKLKAESGTAVASRRCKQVDTECQTCEKAFCLNCFTLYHIKD